MGIGALSIVLQIALLRKGLQPPTLKGSLPGCPSNFGMSTSTKQDLQGWGLVLAVSERKLNFALKKAWNEIPSQYRNIDFTIPVDMSQMRLGTKIAHFTASLGVVQVHAKSDNLQLADFVIHVDSGSVSAITASYT